MKHIKLLVILLLTPFITFSQDSVVTVEENNIKTLTYYIRGEKTLLQAIDENGIKWQEIRYNKDGSGKMTMFNNDGDSILSCEIDSLGLEEGLCVRWHSNGSTAEESNFKKGMKNGLTRQWYENGQLEEEVEFVDNEICDSCKWTRWYPNGNLSQVIQKNTNQHDLFYENGKKKYEIPQHGKSIEYYSSGSIFEVRQWMDESTGTYTRFFEEGQKSEEGDFYDIIKVNVKNAWNKEGKKVIKKGKGKREEVMMTELGPVKMLSYYKKGKIVKMKEIERL